MSIHFILITFEEKEKRNSRFLFFFFFFFLFSLCLSLERVSVSSAHSLYCVVIERARADRECLLFKYFVVVTFFFSSDDGAFAHSVYLSTRDFGKKTEKEEEFDLFLITQKDRILLSSSSLHRSFYCDCYCYCVCVCACARVRN